MAAVEWAFDLGRWSDFWERYQDRVVEGLLALAVALALIVLTNVVLRRMVRRLVVSVVSRAESSRHRDPMSIRRRADTMAATITWVVEIFLVFVGASLVLSGFGLDVTAVAAGLGVAGLGLGLGAQSLVRDVINGMFILIEDQFGVGDVVQITTTGGQAIGGAVEDVNPRRTVLRDLNGDVHIIPNSAILVATNMTQGFSRINLDVSVAYEEDLGRVISVINAECARLATDFPADILKPPAVLRVDALAAHGVAIKVVGDVAVGRQWDLAGELRRRLKDRFDAEGIEIPYPHQTTVLKRRRDAVAGAPTNAPPKSDTDGP